MPGRTSSETNIVDPENSTTTPLGSFGNFTGNFVEVSAYSSVTLTIKSDVGSPFDGVQIQWSTDGVTADVQSQRFTLDPGSVGQGETFHATTRAKFYRISYDNDFTPQSTFVLTAILRKGAAQGTIRSIDPTNTFTPNVDAQVTWALLSTIGREQNQQMQLPMSDDVNLPADGPFLFVSPRPAKSGNLIRRAVPASLTPVQIDDFLRERLTFMSITNAVLRGNLYIQLGTGTGLTTTQYDYKILPGETWEDPGAFGSVWSGDVFGVWDEVYIQSPSIQAGNALFVVNFYG